MPDRESGSLDGRALPHRSHAAIGRVGQYLPDTLGGEGSLVRDEEATVPANLYDSDLPLGMGHWKPGILVTLASRPAFGKTTLALQMALAVARTDHVACRSGGGSSRGNDLFTSHQPRRASCLRGWS